MSSPSIHAPWRMEYIRSLEKPDGGACFICAAVLAKSDAERKQRLVLWQSEHSIILINRYPYTNGHLLVAPKSHQAEIEQLSHAELLDLQIQTTKAITLLKKAMSPQGFNIGINL